MTTVNVAADTCDACGAHAYLYAEHDDWPIGLAYCAHHGTEYLPELTRCGATVIDLRRTVQA